MPSPLERRASVRLERRSSGLAPVATATLERQRTSSASYEAEPRSPSPPSRARSSGGSGLRRSRTSMTATLAAAAAYGGPASPSETDEEVLPPMYLIAQVFTDSPEDRQLLVAFLLHCADLCTPLLPPPASARVCDDLAREFTAQAERERAAGLPVTVMLAPDALAQAKMELGFIDYVVRPLYVQLAALLPDLGHCLALIDMNRARWEGIVAAPRSQAAQDETPAT